jgi:hypothetical protein
MHVDTEVINSLHPLTVEQITGLRQRLVAGLDHDSHHVVVHTILHLVDD